MASTIATAAISANDTKAAVQNAATAAAGNPTKLEGVRTAPPTNPDLVFLFDVDGTLSKPRLSIEPDMVACLYELRKKAWVAVVGGSDQKKILEQLGAGAAEFFDYLFSENGLVGLHNGKEFHRKVLAQHFSEEDRKKFEAWCLEHIKGLVLPKKCSVHVEARSGMWNVSPIGRDCTHQERCEFEEHDRKEKVREHMIAKLKPEFADMNLSFAIGGQISFDVYPKGWDKTYCLQFFDEKKQIHFFGDKTYPGGNDYEIFTSERTIGHTTQGPSNTIELINKVFEGLTGNDNAAAGISASAPAPKQAS